MNTQAAPEGSSPGSNPEEIRFKRIYKACLNCRMRKVKCDLGSVESPREPPCARCQRERRECTFVDLRRGGLANVEEGKRRRLDPPRNLFESPRNLFEPLRNLFEAPRTMFEGPAGRPEYGVASPYPELATMRGAMVFLANAAGTIARADERDNIDAQARVEQLERQDTPPHERPSEYVGAPPELPQLAPLIRPAGSGRTTVPVLGRTDRHLRPAPQSRLADIYYIGAAADGCILTEAEAEMLVNRFFCNLHPFYPHIPESLHSPQVLAGYPLLLGAILTISARYHPFGPEAGPGVGRHVEVHERLWIYVQRLISQTVWAELSTRLMTTVFAFLLFTEWNPRAIHWRWADYANRPEGELRDEREGREPGAAPRDGSRDGSRPDHLTGDDDGDHLTGLGAVRRLDRMAWMLIGSAVRLAQDMGFIESSAHVFLATHISETTSAMNINRRSMLAPLLAEIDLAEMEDGEGETFPPGAAPRIRFTLLQRLKVELLQVMSIGYEYLYGCQAQLSSLTARQKLAVLGILSPLIEKWGAKYKALLVPSTARLGGGARQLGTAIDRESLICDYYYARLYIYSLALANDTAKHPAPAARPAFKLGELSRSAKFVELAFSLAREILAVLHRVHRLKMLQYMSVRWCTRIVRAVAFVVKCYLTMTAAQKASRSTDADILSLSIIPVDELVHLIQRAAITLREASPDELHLCTRYSTILMYLCLRVKISAKTPEPVYPEPDPVYEAPQSDRVAAPETPAFDPMDNGFASNALLDWFTTNDEIGLDFVDSWTAMLEQSMGDAQSYPGPPGNDPTRVPGT